MATLAYDNQKFIFACKFDEREVAKAAGMRWDSASKTWYTTDLAVAVKLRAHAVGFAKKKIQQSLIVIEPWLKPLPLTDLMPHQVDAILFALDRNRSYLGLDPGLGKTACAAVIATQLKQRVVYISPPFLVQNVMNEFARWAPTLKVAAYQNSVGNLKTYESYDVLIVPDTMLTRPQTIQRIKAFSQERGVLIVDEAHRFKNPDAQRTAALFGAKKSAGIAQLFERQIYMSGTPMPNRPVELYTLLATVAPECINYMSYFNYGRRYCAGMQNEYGWDFTGASNVKELARKVIAPLGPFMLRQKKALLNLPPKIEEVFVVSANMSPRLSRLDTAVSKAIGEVNLDVEFMITGEVGTHIATYRRLLGVEKAGAVIEYIKSLMAETDENILIFAYHKDVVKKLQDELTSFKPIVITGDTPVNERLAQVDEYQKNPLRRIIIGNYVAMGVGFTITKATRVIFVEFDWVPGVNEQASDRAHRIGQDKTVLVQYVAYKDSIDKAVLETILRKQRSIKHI